jgi:hypothetical protein
MACLRRCAAASHCAVRMALIDGIAIENYSQSDEHRRAHAVSRVALLVMDGKEQEALDEAHRTPYPFLWQDAEQFGAGWKAAMQLLGYEP